MQKAADTVYPVHTIIAERWSPRSFEWARRLSPDDLMSLFEAARLPTISSPGALSTRDARMLHSIRSSVAWNRPMRCGRVDLGCSASRSRRCSVKMVQQTSMLSHDLGAPGDQHEAGRASDVG